MRDLLALFAVFLIKKLIWLCHKCNAKTKFSQTLFGVGEGKVKIGVGAITVKDRAHFMCHIKIPFETWDGLSKIVEQERNGDKTEGVIND